MATFGETSVFSIPFPASGVDFGETTPFDIEISVPVSGQILGFITGHEPDTQSINGFLRGPFSGSGIINAFTSGSITNASGDIVGFMAGDVVNSKINAFMQVILLQDQINGLLLSETDNQSQINGFVNGNDDVVLSQINAFMPVDGSGVGINSTINALIHTVPESIINGFMKAIHADDNSSIEAFMNGQNVFNESINAFIQRPDDSNSTILGLIEGLEFIGGFMLGGSGLRSIPVGQIGGFIDAVASGDDTESIFGYIRAHDPLNDQIAGLIKVPDIVDIINGFIGHPTASGAGITTNAFLRGEIGDDRIFGFIARPSGENNQINAFLLPHASGSEEVGGFMLGSLDSNGQINALLLGPSGSDSQIIGFIRQDNPDGQIKGLTSGWNGPAPLTP